MKAASPKANFKEHNAINVSLTVKTVRCSLKGFQKMTLQRMAQISSKQNPVSR